MCGRMMSEGHNNLFKFICAWLFYRYIHICPSSNHMTIHFYMYIDMFLYSRLHYTTVKCNFFVEVTNIDITGFYSYIKILH